MPLPGANMPPLVKVGAPMIDPLPVTVPALVKLVNAVRVPASLMVAPAALVTTLALTDRVAAMFTPTAAVELFLSMVMPVRSPPETAAVPCCCC